MKPDVLIVGPLYKPTLDALDREFTTHKLWLAPDGKALLASCADRVRGIAIMVFRASPSALARFEINVGDLLMLGASASWALYTVGSRPLVPSRLAPGGIAHGSRRTATSNVVGRHPNGSCASRRVTVSLGVPWHPQRRHQQSGSTTRQLSVS